MKFLNPLSLASIAIQLSSALARSCVSEAQLSCQADTIPENSWEQQCIDIDEHDWTNPLVRSVSACFCGDEGKAILERFFDCFYERAFACPNRSLGFATSFMVWIMESCYHRGKRRLYCNDDWKPTPPWHKLDNEDMKRHYELGDPYQYSFDSAETVRGVPWHGCEPDDNKKRFGPGWP